MRGGCWLPGWSHKPAYVGSIPTPATKSLEVSMEEHIAHIEILGHKARVSAIKGRLSDNLFHKEDTLDVWVSFDKAVEGLLTFGVELPAKPYSRTEFLDLVVREGEAALRRYSANRAREKAERAASEERQEALDHLAQEVGAEVKEG